MQQDDNDGKLARLNHESPPTHLKGPGGWEANTCHRSGPPDDGTAGMIGSAAPVCLHLIVCVSVFVCL